jgi:hypothetical protein
LEHRPIAIGHHHAVAQRSLAARVSALGRQAFDAARSNCLEQALTQLKASLRGAEILD